MVKLLGSALLVGSLVMFSVPASAQRKAASRSAGAPRQEIGVDFSGAYSKPSGGSGGVDMGLPVDIRLGFLTRSKVMFEPRLSFQYSSGYGAGASYVIVPGLNLLYQLKRGTGPSGLVGAPYLTGGVAVNLYDAFGTSWQQFAIGGGVGKRVAFASQAARFEGFFGYTFKGGGAPSMFSVGTRIGLSFWH